MSDRMSPLGSIMWGVGQDATLRMIVGNLIFLDRTPNRSALAERLGVAALSAPRLRQRPSGGSGARTPAWIDDELFDPDNHIRGAAVASPGDQRQVLDLIALLEPTPFDPSMSPWDITLIEGLADGRAALYLRAHHSLMDGSHGVSIMRSMLDESAAHPPTDESTERSQPSKEPGYDNVVGISSAPGSRRKPGTVSVTIDVAGAVQPIARGAANGFAAALRIDPVDAVVRGVQRSLEVANSVSRQVVVTGGRMSPLSPSRSINTRFETLSVPGARTTALALGGSRNDLLVAGSAMGLGLYHESLGMTCPELRLASPARGRNSSGSAGPIVPTRVEIPVGNGHPGPLFGVVAERLARSRREPVLHVTEALASVISRLPGRLLMSALRSQASSVDFVATSLPWLRGTRHICGAAIEESFPFGPRLGSLINITGFGIDDRLDIGLGLDPGAIEKPEILVECMVDAFARLAATHGSK
jgi:diacylglycerol O-acyltransferase